MGLSIPDPAPRRPANPGSASGKQGVRLPEALGAGAIKGSLGGRRALRGEETELAEEVHLVEEEVLGLQRVAVGGIDCRPPELNASSRRRDIAARSVKNAIVGAHERPFGGCGCSVAEELHDLEAGSGNASWNTARKPITSSRPLAV